MKINLNQVRMRHLRSFLAIAQVASVTSAAKTLGTSQPALSRTLNELESIVGQPLFTRAGRGLELTSAGETFRRHISPAMNRIEDGVILASGKEQKQAVSVGVLPNVERSLAVDAAALFKRKHPTVDLEMHRSYVLHLINLLHRGRLDFILGRMESPRAMPDLSFERLYLEEQIFVAAADHPLAKKKIVTLEDLNNELMIVPIEGTIVRDEVEAFLIARGFSRFANRIESSSGEFVRAFVAKNRAVACVSMGIVHQEIKNGSFIKLAIHADELISPVGIISLPHASHNDAAKNFLSAVRKSASSKV